MKILIKYFGLIMDLTTKKEEVFELDLDVISLEEFKKVLLDKYPQLDKSIYKTAINELIVPDHSKIQHNDTIALLPPFAGG